MNNSVCGQFPLKKLRHAAKATYVYQYFISSASFTIIPNYIVQMF